METIRYKEPKAVKRDISNFNNGETQIKYRRSRSYSRKILIRIMINK